jgi:ribosome recycling factor
MLDNIYKDTEDKMSKSIDALKNEYKTLRTGKVSTSVLDNVKVDYYGTPTPIAQVGTVLAQDATTIAITPWEKTMIDPISKAIAEANIGVNPNSDAEGVKLFFPPMTSEQRKEVAKQAKVMTDNAKVAIRNIRKDANNKVKNLLKDKEITEDENKGAQDKIQKFTDDFVAKSDAVFKEKEAEILKV